MLATESRLAAFGCLLSCSCTFYTNCPNTDRAVENCPEGNNGGTGAGSNGDGGEDPGGAGSGGSTSQGSATVDPATVDGSWSDATGNLAGTPAGFGNVCYVASRGEQQLLAGVSEGGLWTSDDAGETWNPLGTAGGSVQVNNRTTVIVADPDDAAAFWEAGSYGGGVFFTRDQGESFVQLGTIQHAEGLAVDLSDPDRSLLFAGVHEQGGILYRSLNGGEDWEDIFGPEATNPCGYPLVVDTDNVLVSCSRWGDKTGGIFRSSDAGDNWQLVSSESGWETPLVASDGTIYWSVESGGGILTSSDHGMTFTRRSNGLFRVAHPIELPDGRVAAIAGQAIVTTADRGANWRRVTPEAPFVPAGLAYSAAHRSFFVWQLSVETTIPDEVILSFSVDGVN